MTEILNVSLDLSPADAALAVDVVGRLIKGGLTGATQMPPEEESMYLATLRTKILAYIDAHLERPDLSTMTLMERFCISRAGLYRALEVDGGVARVIRDRRLNAAFELLSRRDGMAISQIAYTYGFSSPQQFFKAFHRKFGVAPSEARELDSGSIAAPNIGTVVSHYVKMVRQP
jgi:AraC-like DNA-binding protein